KATMIDEKHNLVKIIDKDINKEPIFFTAQPDHIVYENEPPQTKYYVNFTYDTSDAVYLSYLRSNLNWKTRYQLNLFENVKPATFIAMADIRNDGQSKVDIESAELLSDDINLKVHPKPNYTPMLFQGSHNNFPNSFIGIGNSLFKKSVGQGEEIFDLYVFSITEPISINAKTNYLLPMLHPQVIVEQYASISTHFNGAGNVSGKAERTFCLSSDRSLSRGDCIIRESDRLVDQTYLPDIAAKHKHEFSVGKDADIVYKENATLVSSFSLNTTTSLHDFITTSKPLTYEINLSVKNYKTNRAVKIDYQKHMFSSSIKLVTSNANITLENSIIKYTTILEANEEKILTYTFEITNRYIGLTIHTLSIHGLLDSFRKKPIASTSDLRVLANVKIYSNLAEIIQPLGKLPIEFSSEDWNNIRSDSVTLVGNNVTITQQTLTEKKKSLNNAQVYVRAPSSSNTETKFVKATMIDEKHNLVKII
ncbi:unnamed protein product, partial [Rotaria sp. Silwood1]